MKPFVAAVLLTGAALSGCAFAQAQQASDDPNSVKAGTYRVDPAHTQVNWAVSHLGFSVYEGRFDKVSGTLVVHPGDPANDTLDVAIQTDSVNTPSSQLTQQLAGPNWFDAKRFPTITFKSTRVTPTAPGAAMVVGDLTLHGVTRPVTLDVRFVGAGLNLLFAQYTVGFQASGTIKRSDFGVSGLVPAIGDTTTLRLNGAFVRQ